MTFSIRRKASFISLNLLSLNLRYRGILCYSIKFKYIYLYLCGPIEPCVQTVLEEARPNTSLIRTNGVRKGQAQYPV